MKSFFIFFSSNSLSICSFLLSVKLQNFHFLFISFFFFFKFILRRGFAVHPTLAWNSPICSPGWSWTFNPSSIFPMLGLLVLCHHGLLGRKFLLDFGTPAVEIPSFPLKGEDGHHDVVRLKVWSDSGTSRGAMGWQWDFTGSRGLVLWLTFLCLPSYLPSKEKDLGTWELMSLCFLACLDSFKDIQIVEIFSRYSK